jgi:hypothetical protein
MRRAEVRDGDWRLLEPVPAWDGNATWERFVAFTWSGDGGHLLATVNYGDTGAQCFVPLSLPDLDGRTWLLRDLVHPGVEYRRDGGDLARRGLYLDLPAWGHHVFELTASNANGEAPYA